MSITLFYAPIACSLVPYVALLEAGAKFDVRVVNFLKGEHLQSEYLKVNPKHKVPVLAVDDTPLTENVAILQWIARQYPDAKLLPEGFDQFKAISLMSWCASGIHPSLTPNARPERYCDFPGSEESVKQCAQKAMHENFVVAEDLLAGRDWFFDQFSLPDIYFFWCFRRALSFGVDLSQYVACNAHNARVAARDSVAEVLAFEKQTLAEWAAA